MAKRRRTNNRKKPEFDQEIVDLARVTRVTKGGKQLNFRACIILGDRKGRVGFGIEKGKDVQIAIEKAVRKAKKNIIQVPIMNESLPHRIVSKYKAAKVMLKPAPPGSGIIAGSVVRTILDLAGVPNASAKMLGKTNNNITNVRAVFKALQGFKVDPKVMKNAPVKKKTAEQSIDKKTKTNKKPTATKKKAADKKDDK